VMMKSSSSLKPEVEDKRRQRAELRRTYGNLVSSININVMRQKQKVIGKGDPHPAESGGNQLAAAAESAAVAVAAAVAATAAAAAAAAANGAPVEPQEENSLRRIASSFAHVSDLPGACCEDLPLEDSEQDAKEERAEVLIRSQTMPLPMNVPRVPLKPLELPSLASKQQEVADDSESRLAKILPYTLQFETRATERWMRLGSTVSALFRARRNIDVAESPMATTRRLREQRELLEAFTRPFLYEPTSRD
ncbi:hypothetical protein KR054_007866, partial [Drosophila jambulina]